MRILRLFSCLIPVVGKRAVRLVAAPLLVASAALLAACNCSGIYCPCHTDKDCDAPYSCLNVPGVQGGTTPDLICTLRCKSASECPDKPVECYPGPSCVPLSSSPDAGSACLKEGCPL